MPRKPLLGMQGLLLFALTSVISNFIKLAFLLFWNVFAFNFDVAEILIFMI